MATPIGNIADLSLRAVHVLALVDAVACEDTRVSAGLLQRLGLGKPLIALHEHNEEAAAPRVIERLASGERVAYVSDAGTPAISDPGARLVAAVREAGFRVIPLPGPSSVVTALSAAGDIAGQGFRFAGFVSPKATARERDLRRLAEDAGTTPAQFVTRLRLEAASAAIRDTAAPLAEIAHWAGFSDQSALTRALRRETGITPGALRRRSGTPGPGIGTPGQAGPADPG